MPQEAPRHKPYASATFLVAILPPALPMMSSALLLLPLLLCLFAGDVTAARSCKTFVISYTVSSGVENFEFRAASLSSDTTPPRYLGFYSVLLPVYPRPILRHRLIPRPLQAAADEPGLRVSSLRNRARDVLVVAVGLLFGAGCGALAAAAMYLAWSLVAGRYDVCGSDGYDDNDLEESPKKVGYVVIPAAADPVPAAKEGYEGN